MKMVRVSAAWFFSRGALFGVSFATVPRLKSQRLRSFFPLENVSTVGIVQTLALREQ
jgi:hypothetical protein